MRALRLALGMAAALTMVACGDDSPTAPNGGPDNVPSDVPELPTPGAPGADVSPVSSTLTSIRLLETPFRPEVLRARGSWFVEQRHCEYEIFPVQEIVHSPWNRIWLGKSWSDEIPQAPTLPDFGHDLLLLGAGGEPVRELPYEFTESGPQFTFPGMEWDQKRVEGTITPLEAMPYLRRDRWWELKPLAGGAGTYLLLVGEAEGAITTTITSGSSKTETESFGRSISANVGASYGILSASVEATLTQTFSTSVTVYEERSETFEKRVKGKSGKVVQFMVWELVERYSFTDEFGEPFTDASYEFELPELARQGVATALQATEFDDRSN